MRLRWLALLLVGLGGWLVQAQTGEKTLDALEQQLRQQQQIGVQQQKELEKLRASLETLSASQQQTLARLDALSADIQRLTNEGQVLAVRVRRAESELSATTRELEYRTYRVSNLRSNVRGLMNSLYREGSGDYLELLAQSSSLSELLIRLRYANFAGEYNVALITNLEREVTELQAQQQRQQAQQQALAKLQKDRAEALARLKQSRDEQAGLLAELQKTAEGQRLLALQNQAQQQQTVKNIEGIISGIMQERAALDAARAAREAESRRRAEEVARLQAAQREAEARARRAQAAQAAQGQPASASSQAAPGQAPAAGTASTVPSAAQQARALREQQARAQAERDTLAQQQQRAQAEADVAAAAAAPLPSEAEFIFPLPGGQVREPFTPDTPWAVLEGPPQAQVVAAADGDVLASTFFNSLGWVVLVDHGGWVTAYLGLQEPGVQVGQRVRSGEALALPGGSPVFGPDRAAFQLNRLQGGSEPLCRPLLAQVSAGLRPRAAGDTRRFARRSGPRP
ncbi:murein hydrolase activator EnvC family protein [Deinococcus lacus]|uniref:Murein hydrolase activator EnvC family protein n=1 Tax=Deinococcus lacus TaxID=392561 RepID=A0ABW1Y8U5_9DEIO